ncbi:MAG: DHH family phosphoesterase, partial [Chloroflexia bacterium]|nr:DHH family phosphoesterase [Chloroflexia bacterium]
MRISQLIDSRPELIEPGVIPPRSTWRDLDPHPLVAAILYRRGMRTAEDVATFMEPAHHPTPDPYRIPNMRAAVERILLAVHRDERVGVFGDYDADGITSTAILTLALRSSLAPERVIPRLPDRAEGYGLNETAIEEFRDAGVSLVVAVDCGSTDHRSAAAIAGHGMDLVILDHHHMRNDGPPTAVTVSPQLDEDAA